VKITIIEHLIAFNLSRYANYSSFSCSYEILSTDVPDANIPVCMRDLQLKVFLINEGRVMRNDDVVSLAILTYGAIEICTIESLAPNPLIRRDCGLMRKEKVLDGLRINSIILSD